MGGLLGPLLSSKRLSEEQAKLGEDINRNDVVLRMNNAPTLGYEEFVGNFTTVRLTNTQYEGVREYEGETVVAKWSGYPPDIGRWGE